MKRIIIRALVSGQTALTPEVLKILQAISDDAKHADRRANAAGATDNSKTKRIASRSVTPRGGD